MKELGRWAFILGVIIALVLGILSTKMTPIQYTWLVGVLVVLGVLIGFLNITGKETMDFLTISVMLVVAVSLGGQALKAGLDALGAFGGYLSGIFYAVMLLLIPSILIVSLKAIWNLAKN